MTGLFRYVRAVACSWIAILAVSSHQAYATTLFFDSFQGNLSQWNNPASSGAIVTALDGGKALTFDLLQGGSSLLTTKSGFTSPTGSFTLSFDLLANCGHTNGCGMFFAINGSNWFLSDTGFGSDKLFPDAPAWETISYTFAGSSLSNLAMEDWNGSPYSQAYPGTNAVYLRNLTITDNPGGIAVGTLTTSAVSTPEPAALALLGIGLLGLIPARLNRGRRAAI
jgi:hypothetical protein